MLKAYSLIKDLDKSACEIIENAGIQIDFSSLGKAPSKEELANIIKNYDILIISIKDKISKDVFENINSKKIIATASSGIDHIDESLLKLDTIKIINCPTGNAVSVAEHIFSLILALKKQIIESNDVSIQGKTKKSISRKSNDINGCSIGIIGAGHISREVMKIAKAFNMKIYCNTIDPENNQDLLEDGVKFISLDELLSKSDIITVNIPLNEENKNLISKDKIMLMKPTATFINTARAEISDVNELIKYADENPAFNVGLDIDIENYKEILNVKRNNVIVTPHTAGMTQEAIKRVDIELANNLVKFLKNEK